MDAKIKIQVFGEKNYKLPMKGCNCSNKKNNSSGCRGCGGNKCGSKTSNNSNSKITKTIEDGFCELKKSLLNSDIKNNIAIEYIDIKSLDFQSNYTRVDRLINEGFDLPIIVIDDIVRYYGGISTSLVYKDIKELLEL